MAIDRYQNNKSNNKPQKKVSKEVKPGEKISSPQDTSSPRNFQVIKSVWAAYANMARQNIYQTLCHISHILGYEINRDDTRLEENLMMIPAIRILGSKGKAEEIAKAMKMIDCHFPFVSPMLEKLIQINNRKIRKDNKNVDRERRQPEIKEKTPALYYELFQMILPLINLLRNYYSHHEFYDKRIDTKSGRITDDKLCIRCDKLASLLDFCMAGARRTVKERFSAGSEATFTKEDFDFFEGELRYYDHIVVNKDNRAILDNRGRKTKVKRERRDYIYRIGDKTEEEKYVSLTDMGRFLLICLFLTKKYVKEFGDKADFWGMKLPTDKRPSEKGMAIMRETACVYRIRLPKERLQSEKDQSAVGLDMLNELKKCPKELFETLSVTDQDKFRVEVNDNSEGEETSVLMLRSFDRFPTLALRYLDTMRMFDRIRFQVQLGNYRYDFYGKKWIDEDEDRVRILQKELMGYGRLDEIEVQRNSRWGNLIRRIDEPRKDSLGDCKPYITDHYASYNIRNNHIGLQWNSGRDGILDKTGIFMPSTVLPEWVYDKTKKTGDDRPVAECHAPKCWLSVYDLPAVCFLTLLTGSGRCAEDLIISTVERYNTFFRDVAEGKIVPYDKETKISFIPTAKKEAILRWRKQQQPYSYIIEPYGIDIAALPRKIQDYLLDDDSRINGESLFKRLAAEKLQMELERTERRLERIKEELAVYAEKDNKLGKKSHVDIRQGSLARFLAKDIVYFKEPDEEGNGVLTSQNFNILQQELALYRMDLRQWEDFFMRAGLLGRKKPHPFLQKVLDCGPRNFYDFYIIYLQKRQKQLEEWISGGENILTSLHFLHSKRAKWQNRNKEYYRELVKRYSTIELPGNLFLDAIVEKLKETELFKSGNSVLTEALNRERKNAAYLISAYMKATGSGYQPYYDYTRCYKYFSMTYKPQWDINTPVPSLKERYLTVEQMEKYIKDYDSSSREESYIGSLAARKDALAKKAKLKGRYDLRKERSLMNQVREDSEAAPEKLSRSYKFYTGNERVIRLRKVQDAVLFLMAKDVLTHTMGDGIDLSAYRLRDIGKDGDQDILSMQLPFAIRLQIPVDENGTKSVREITIRQDDLKLKNYGDFFRFIYDSRIRPLLAQVDVTEIDRATLEKELDNYDLRRIPLFECVHDLERRVCRSLSYEQLHPINEEGDPIKVDFKYLIRFVDIKESNARLLCDIRNAFCHSTYPEGTKVNIVFTESGVSPTIPEVALTLVDDFSRRTKSVTSRQKP